MVLPPQAPGKTILVVVDHPTTRAVVAALVRKLGYEVEVVRAEAAVEESTKAHWDAALIDLDLDAVDGVELGRRLRDLPSTAKSPLIAISARDRSGDRQRCLAAGFDAFFVKPLKKADLEETLAPSPVHSSLDRERLDSLIALEKQVGQRVVEPMVHSFLESTKEVLPRLREACETRDFNLLRSEAHGLVGRAVNLGAVAVGAVCREIEALARARDCESANRWIDHLENELELVSVEFKAYLETLG